MPFFGVNTTVASVVPTLRCWKQRPTICTWCWIGVLNSSWRRQNPATLLFIGFIWIFQDLLIGLFKVGSLWFWVRSNKNLFWHKCRHSFGKAVLILAKGKGREHFAFKLEILQQRHYGGIKKDLCFNSVTSNIVFLRNSLRIWIQQDEPFLVCFKFVSFQKTTRHSHAIQMQPTAVCFVSMDALF